MELVCLSEVGTPELTSLSTSEVVPEASQGHEEGGQFENHCESELLPKA